MVGLAHFLIVAGLVVLLVRHLCERELSHKKVAYLSARLVEGGVWTLCKVDSLHFVGLLVVPRENLRLTRELLT